MLTASTIRSIPSKGELGALLPFCFSLGCGDLVYHVLPWFYHPDGRRLAHSTQPTQSHACSSAAASLRAIPLLSSSATLHCDAKLNATLRADRPDGTLSGV